MLPDMEKSLSHRCSPPRVFEPLAALLQDYRDRGERFGIINDGWFAVEAEMRRERRFVPRLPFLALD